jgi:hypothetical protein
MHPRARKVDQCFFLFLGFGLGGPKQGLVWLPSARKFQTSAQQLRFR